MDIINRLFSTGNEKNGPEDLMGITKIIRPLLDRTSNDVFMSHKSRLLTQPIDYIAPAVWGAKKDGELESTQKEIHREIDVVVRQIFDSMQLEGLGASQEFAIVFLIRELIISKITFLIELAKDLAVNQIRRDEYHTDVLNQLSPSGNA